MNSRPIPALAYALATFGVIVQSIAFGLAGPHPATVWAGPVVVATVMAGAWILGAAGGRAPRAVRIVAAAPWAIAAVGVLVYEFEAAHGFPSAARIASDLALVVLAAIATDGIVVAAGGVWRRPALPGALTVGLFPLIALCVTIPGAVIHLMVTELSPPSSPPRLVAALDVLVMLRDRYPHWSAAPLSFVDLVSRHRDRLHAAVAGCRDDARPCPAVVDVLRDALSELDNGHVYVEWPDNWVEPDVETRLVEDRAAVVWADDDRIAPGDVIESVDGLSIDAALARLPHWATAGVAAKTRRHDGHRRLLLGRERTAVDLVLRRPDGTAYEARLERTAVTTDVAEDDRADDTEESEATDAEEPDDSEASEESESTPLHGSKLDDGVVYMCVEEFEQPAEFVNRLDRLVREVARDRGMVVDFRRCPGGDIDLLERFLGRFIGRSVTVGNLCEPDPTPTVSERISCAPLRVEPDGPRVWGSIAVLVGPDTASAAEIAAHFLCSTGRARCFGETTSGETDVAEEVVVEGVTISVSVAGFEPLDGPLLLGRGVVPDEPVTATLADVREEADPVLDAARAWLATRRVAAR